MVVVLCVFGSPGRDAIPREFEVSGLKFEVFPLCSSHSKLDTFSEPLHGVTANDAGCPFEHGAKNCSFFS